LWIFDAFDFFTGTGSLEWAELLMAELDDCRELEDSR